VIFAFARLFDHLVGALCGRSNQPQGVRARRRFPSCRPCSKDRDIDNSNLLRHRRRSSESRPGCEPQSAGRGNVTGVAFFSALLGAKRLGLLHELVPAAGTFALLVNPNNANAESLTRDLQAAGHTLGKQILVLPASTEREIDRQFASLDQQQVGALIVAPDAFFDSQRDHIVELVARQAIPAIYERHEAATAGGLMSYGANVADAYHQAGIYTGRSLRGEKPADLPVMQPTKLEFVINLRTAKALDLTIPPGVLAIADEVIE
jgi:putative tryptophan/tyrosine transport system substrate-binding protein